MEINKIALFHELNQRDEKWSRNACSFFAPAVNLKYNCGITLTEKDLKIIADKQEKKGKFFPKYGGGIEDGVKAVYDYLDKKPKLIHLNKTIEKEKLQILEYIKNGYSVIGGISVNSSFYQDAKDGKIEDYKDYKKYFGNKFKHVTNLTRWIGRGDDSVRQFDFILDSFAYGKKEWLYETDIKEIIENIGMNNYFLFK